GALAIAGIVLEPPLQKLRERADAGQRIADLVRDRRDEAAERREVLRVRELALERHAVGEVDHAQERERALVRLQRDRAQREDPQPSAPVVRLDRAVDLLRAAVRLADERGQVELFLQERRDHLVELATGGLARREAAEDVVG